MYPTKSAIDYAVEINRLFQNTNDNDIFATQTNSQLSPFSSSTINRSSSSADSISPESFPDLPHRLLTAPSAFSPQHFTRTEPDSPFITHRHRPIIGRRLMTSDPTPKLKEENPNYSKWDVDISIWQPEEAFSKPSDNNIFTVNKNSSNAFYELFPENKRPVKNSDVSQDSSNISPRHMRNSPSLLNMPPNMCLSEPLIPNRSQTPSVITGPMFGPSSSKYCDTAKVCTFCRKNGETPLVYTTHVVKQRVGNKQIVTCPILRSHVCATCGMTGDQAHTMTYCPVLRNSNNGQPLLSTTITLKNTRVKSNGRRRY